MAASKPGSAMRRRVVEDDDDVDDLLTDFSTLRVVSEAPSSTVAVQTSVASRAAVSDKPTISACSTDADIGVDVVVDAKFKPLRAYQREIVAQLDAAWQTYSTQRPTASGYPPTSNAICLYMPTGAGKTRVCGEFLRNVLKPLPAARSSDAARHPCRALFIVNRSPLVAQAAAAFRDLGLDDGDVRMSFIKAGREFVADSHLFIASIQTLTRRFGGDVSLGTGMLTPSATPSATASRASVARNSDSVPMVDVVCVDEAHAAMSPTYIALFARLGEAAAACGRKPPFLLGLTATPTRLNPSEKLSTIFGRLLLGPSVSQLIAQGVLAKPITLQYFSKQLDGSSTAASRTPRDDAVAPKASKEMRRLVKFWRANAAGRRTLVFAASIAQSKDIVAAFRRKDVAAVHVDGDTPEDVRQTYFAQLHTGELLVCSSVGVLSEGFDEPRVAAIILCNPTTSRSRYLQQVGRGLRCASGKADCIIIDTTDNTLRFGPIGALNEPSVDASSAAGSSAGASARRREEDEWEWQAETSATSRAPHEYTSAAAAVLASAGGTSCARRDSSSKPSTACWVCDRCAAINHSRIRSCHHCGASKTLSVFACHGSGSSSVSSGAAATTAGAPRVRASVVDDLVATLGAVRLGGKSRASSAGRASQAAAPSFLLTSALNVPNPSGVSAPAVRFDAGFSIPKRSDTPVTAAAAASGAPPEGAASGGSTSAAADTRHGRPDAAVDAGAAAVAVGGSTAPRLGGIPRKSCAA